MVHHGLVIWAGIERTVRISGSPKGSEGHLNALGDNGFKVKFSDKPPFFLLLYNGFYCKCLHFVDQ